MVGIYVGNDFQRLMARAEVENSFFLLGGESGEREREKGRRQQEEDKKKEKEQIKRSLELRNHEACLNVPTAEEVIN